MIIMQMAVVKNFSLVKLQWQTGGVGRVGEGKAPEKEEHLRTKGSLQKHQQPERTRSWGSVSSLGQ